SDLSIKHFNFNIRPIQSEHTYSELEIYFASYIVLNYSFLLFILTSIIYLLSNSYIKFKCASYQVSKIKLRHTPKGVNDMKQFKRLMILSFTINAFLISAPTHTYASSTDVIKSEKTATRLNYIDTETIP